MYKKRLLNRIKHFNKFPEDRLKTQNVFIEINSIKEHLNKLLTTREMTTLIADDYGLSDISNIHNEFFSEFLISLKEEIFKKIDKYEPRLKDIKVEFIKTDNKKFNLKFEIEARLKSDNYTNIIFQTTIYPEGKVILNEQ